LRTDVVEVLWWKIDAVGTIATDDRSSHEKAKRQKIANNENNFRDFAIMIIKYREINARTPQITPRSKKHSSESKPNQYLTI
jgi:hypothetical protein